jgi:hypothetical protein
VSARRRKPAIGQKHVKTGDYIGPADMSHPERALVTGAGRAHLRRIQSGHAVEYPTAALHGLTRTRKERAMTRTTLALLSALAVGGLALPAQAQDWTVGSLPAHASEGVPGAAANPAFGGGWAGQVTGEAGGSFDARYATPIYGGGQRGIVTGEAAGSFDRDLAVRLGVVDSAENVLAALIAAARG